MTLLEPGSAHVLYVSACAAERCASAAAFLRAAKADAPMLMLVPSPNAGLWLMRDALPPGAARFDWRRLSLEQHGHALARPLMLARGQSYLSPVAAQALCTRIMLELAERKELGRFAAVSGQPGFGRALFRSVSELRLARVDLDLLAQHDPDLAHIAAAFQAELEAQALVDSALLYAIASEPARALRVESLLALDIPVVHAAEAELVRAIGAGCQNACVTIPHGDTQTLDAFREALPTAAVRILQPRALGELGRLQARLFEPATTHPTLAALSLSNAASAEARKPTARESTHSEHAPTAAAQTSPAPSHDSEQHAASAAASVEARALRSRRARKGSSAQVELFGAFAADAPCLQPSAAPATGSDELSRHRDAAGSPRSGAEPSGSAAPSGAGTHSQVDSSARPRAEHDAPSPAADSGADAHFHAGPSAPPRSVGLGPAAQSGGEEQRVHFVSSPGESRECVEVARSVLDAAHSGVAFDRMAILVRSVDNYRGYLEEALARAQIPAHFAAGVRRPAPEGRAFALLLRCADSGLSLRRFAEYLSLSVMPRSDEEDATPVSPRYWERLLMQAQVGGHSATWHKQLTQLAARWQDELQLLAADATGQRDTRMQQLAALQALTSFTVPLLARIENLPARASFVSFREQLSELAEHALKEPGQVQALLSELSPLDQTQLGRRELFQLLAPQLQNLIVPSEGNGAGKLQVLPIEEARGRSFERVFIVGLAEKLMPPRIREDPLLPDSVRAQLSPALARTPERVAQERLALRIATAAAREHLQLSFPRFDAEQGRPRVPSFYGLEVLEAVDGRLPAWSELGERAAQGAAARLGWPAPEEPARAIDDAEYDLAMIARARSDEASRTGALRYLLGSNPHLARALRFRWRRWELQKFGAADGFVVSDEGVRALLQAFLEEHSYSPSALEQLAVCPYRFYLRNIARVSSPEPPSTGAALDARERGVLFHKLMHETFTQLGAAPIDPAAAEEALERALAQLQSERSERLDPSRTRLVELELRSLRNDLHAILRDQASDSAWAPRVSELSFGASAQAPVKVAGLRLTGAIDLVEQSTSASERPLLRATDFKTGRMHEELEHDRPKGRFITAGGHILQPLLYALALEQLFPEADVRAGRLYYCTRQQQFESFVVELNERTREVANQLAQSASELLAQGFLPAAPERDACNRCEYQVICGPHEAERVERVKQRDAGRLRSLSLLRRLP